MNSRRGGALVAFILGLAIGGVAGVWLTREFQARRADRLAQIEQDERALNQSTSPGAPVEADANDSASSEDRIARKLREWNLDPESLKRELSRAGEVIRREGRRLGDRLSEATSDARIITVIKAKYTLDRYLSALAITVACDDGHVTLTGTVSSPDLIGRAVLLALETDGVVDVESHLKVQPEANPRPEVERL